MSGSADNLACIWSLETCECSHVLEGHTDAVNEVVIKVSRGGEKFVLLLANSNAVLC